MGLSVVISGAIMMVALMFVLYSIPTLLGSITSVGDTSSEISALENKILQTEIRLDSLSANSSMPSFRFDLNNINIEKLWDFEEFDVLVTYDADVSGTKTRVTESIPFNSIIPSYTILAEVTSTSANTAPGAYADIPDLTANVNVVGPDSHILFHTNVSFRDSAGSDCSARVALFIDNVMVAEAEDFSDDDVLPNHEPGNVGLTWWETGLASGAHDFDVRWLDQQQNCEIDVITEQSMQVIEFTPDDGVPTLLTQGTSLSSESYPNTYSPVGGMRGPTNIGSPDSLVLTSGTVSFDEDGTGDASCYLGIFIDGIFQAEQATFTDHEQFGSSVGILWGETGLSADTHTIEFQAREGQTGCGTETDMQRHIQVVEYTSGNPTILAEETTTLFQDFNGVYTRITDLEDTVTIDGPGSLVLFTATVTFDSTPTTAEGDAALFIDGSMVAEGRTYIENAANEPGHVNLHWWTTGLSTGTHDFEVMAKDGDQPGARIDIQTQSHMQVVEFPCTKQWNLASISNDIFNPGIINPEETAKIHVELCNPIFDKGNVIVSLSTDNGVTASISGIAT